MTPKLLWDYVNELKDNPMKDATIPKIPKAGKSIIEIDLTEEPTEDFYRGNTISQYIQYQKAKWHVSSNVVFDKPRTSAWNIIATVNGITHLAEQLKDTGKKPTKVYVFIDKKSCNDRKAKYLVISEKETENIKKNLKQK